MKRTLAILLAAALLAGCGTPAKPPATEPAPTSPPPVPAPAQEPKPATLDGPIHLLEAPAQALFPGPASVVVENSPMSRPQSGLNEADLVLEVLSEGEITRYLAFYWSRTAAKIGPVRSARTGFVTIAEAYRVPFAHAGGNEDALDWLKAWDGMNLDEIYGSWQYFWRSQDRAMPHNLYTSTQLLQKSVSDRKLASRTPGVTARVTPSDNAPAGSLKAQADFHKLYSVTWDWDGKQFLRRHGQSAHKVDSGEPISATNLVFLDIPGVYHGDELGWRLSFEGGGKAAVLTGAHYWEGKWSLGPGGFQLHPDGGKAPPLVPGKLWVHLMTPGSSYRITRP